MEDYRMPWQSFAFVFSAGPLGVCLANNHKNATGCKLVCDVALKQNNASLFF